MSHLLCAVKRARILKEGSLTLIPYGMDERLTWAERIGHFTRQARFAFFNFVDLPLHNSERAVLDSLVQREKQGLGLSAIILGTTSSPMPPT